MATGDGDLQAAAALLSGLREGVEAHPETERLETLYREMRALREKIEEELEELALRRAYPAGAGCVPCTGHSSGDTPVYTSLWRLQVVPLEYTPGSDRATTRVVSVGRIDGSWSKEAPRYPWGPSAGTSPGIPESEEGGGDNG